MSNLDRLLRLKQLKAEPSQFVADEEIVSIFQPVIDRIKEDSKPTEKELLKLIKPLIPRPIKGDPGHTPTNKELLAIIVPLLNAVKPTTKEIIEMIKPLIPKPLKGKTGDKGDKPDHKWEDTKLMFEKPDGSWGKAVDLKGPVGETVKSEITRLGGSVTGGKTTIKDDGTTVSSAASFINFGDGITATANGSGVDVTVVGGSGAVDSVNGQTGVVVLDADDIDDTTTAHKFVTATDITNLGNLSGTNSGDDAVNALYSGLVSNATHTGDAEGDIALTVKRINGVALSGLATGILKNTTGTGVPSIAVAGDFPTLNQNTTGSAATLTTTRTIWGQNFNGSANVTGTFTSTIADTTNVDAMTLTQSDTTNNKDGLVITGATTGRMIKLVPTGNTPVNAATGGAFLLDNTSNSGIGMHLYSNQASAAGLGALLRIHADNTSFAQPALHIVQDGTGGGATNIRLDGPAPQIEFVELDQTTPAGKFEIGVNGDIFYISGRNSGDTTFEDTIKFDRQQNGGGIRLYGTTSGYTKIVPNATAGTTTLTLPAATDTLVAKATTDTLTNKRITKRTGTTTSSATPTINTDNVDFYSITAQTEAITSFTTNLSGTPTEGQTLWIAITGTAARAITWGSSFEASTVALPTTTVSTNRLDVGFVWNTVTNKWRCIASA